MPRKVVAVDGHEVTVYGQRELDTITQDSNGTTRNASHRYEVVDITGYQAILGYPTRGCET